MSTWQDVGSVADLERDGHVIARVDGREIGVVAVGDELRGVRNRCPHHGGPLCLGTVRERVAGEPGRYELGGQSVLRCPWHGWEFDPATGQLPRRTVNSRRRLSGESGRRPRAH